MLTLTFGCNFQFRWVTSFHFRVDSTARAEQYRNQRYGICKTELSSENLVIPV